MNVAPAEKVREWEIADGEWITKSTRWSYGFANERTLNRKSEDWRRGCDREAIGVKYSTAHYLSKNAGNSGQCWQDLRGLESIQCLQRERAGK
ncbi:hypothetical protein Ancab_018647 [Ancistrocladus abbreviatus]